MKKIKVLAIFNALSLIAHISVAYITQAKMINKQDISEVSAKYESLFTPAGITFSIWGVIYITLGLLCLYYIVCAYKHDNPHPANTEVKRMNTLFIMLNLASAVWMIAWTQERLSASVALIFLQLICLILIHHRLNIYNPLKPASLKISSQFPLSIYLGWISIATIANTSSYLSAVKWDGFGLTAVQWVIIMISLSLIISVIMILGRRNIYFGLVAAWGLYGIILKREDINPDFNSPVITFSWASIIIILLLSAVQLVRNLTYKKPADIFPSAPVPLK